MILKFDLIPERIKRFKCQTIRGGFDEKIVKILNRKMHNIELLASVSFAPFSLFREFRLTRHKQKQSKLIDHQYQ